MLSLPIFLFYVTSVLATGNYYGQTPQASNYPMDYFDDGFNRDLKISPDSTFSFNFEQTRRDQPPQVEMREENVGRYFYTRPQTTTPASIFSMTPNRQSQHVYATSVNNHQQQASWNTQQVAAVPPPPKFAFSKPHNTPEIQTNSAPVWNVPTVHQNPHPENPFSNIRPQVPTAQPLPSHSNSAEGIRFSPSASYVSDSVSNKKFNVPHAMPTPPSRGNHKFSWDDIKKNEQINPIVNYQQPGVPQITTPSTPQSIHNKPPPPVPTLSPWYDNFGK